MTKSFTRKAFLSALAPAAALVLTGALPARAASDPAVGPIDSFDSALLATMKEGKSLGYRGRYTKLKPVIERSLDLPAMTRFAVGPSWSTMSEADRSELINAFTRLTVASYAHNFDSYSGQTFTTDPNVVTRGPDKLVRTKLAGGSSGPVSINYRMRENGGSWKVIDVYFNGTISQLTTRRSDFASTLASGGPRALAAHLNDLADKQAN
jgi:phospholipid transport system substrate-binding protein